MFTLKNWFVAVQKSSPFQAPELGYPVLCGEVHGHPNFSDGYEIVTSEVVRKTSEGDVVTNSGSIYRLEDINASYEANFPNAKERLLASLKEA